MHMCPMHPAGCAVATHCLPSLCPPRLSGWVPQPGGLQWSSFAPDLCNITHAAAPCAKQQATHTHTKSASGRVHALKAAAAAAASKNKMRAADRKTHACSGFVQEGCCPGVEAWCTIMHVCSTVLEYAWTTLMATQLPCNKHTAPVPGDTGSPCNPGSGPDLRHMKAGMWDVCCSCPPEQRTIQTVQILVCAAPLKFPEQNPSWSSGGMIYVGPWAGGPRTGGLFGE